MKAYAKLNLTLDILDVRGDGYHELRSVMQQISLHDTLVAKKTSGTGFKFICKSGEIPRDGKNLVCKAALKMISEYKIDRGFNIKLVKRIPVSAGLGGGSADCAAALKCVARLFEIDVCTERLIEIGGGLGSDVPFCLFGGTARVSGAGERLERLGAHPKCCVVVARPPVSVSTGEAFARFDKSEKSGRTDATAAMVRAIEGGNLKKIADSLGNDFLPGAIAECPAVGGLIECMRQNGALNSSMTGSGPSVFGYFETYAGALGCVKKIKSKFRDVKEIFAARVINGGAARGFADE